MCGLTWASTRPPRRRTSSTAAGSTLTSVPNDTVPSSCGSDVCRTTTSGASAVRNSSGRSESRAGTYRRAVLSRIPGPTNEVSWTTPGRVGSPRWAFSTCRVYDGSAASTRPSRGVGMAKLPEATTRGCSGNPPRTCSRSVSLTRCSPEGRVPAGQPGAGRAAPDAPGVAGEGEAEDGHREGAEDVVVQHRVVRRGEHHGPHHEVQQAAGHGGDPHREAERQRQADAEQAEHEQDVSPGRARDAVVEAREGAVRAEGEEPLGGAAAVDPRRRAEAVDVTRLVDAGGVAEGQQLVGERPQERQPEGDPQQRQGLAGR